MTKHHIKWRCNWPPCSGAIREREWTQSERIEEGYANLVLRCSVCGNVSAHSEIIEDKEEKLS